MATMTPTRSINQTRLTATIELARNAVCELEDPERDREFFGEVIVRIPFQAGQISDGVTVKIEELLRLPVRRSG